MTCTHTLHLDWQAGNTEKHILRTSSQDAKPINITSGEMQVRTSVNAPTALLTKMGTVEGNLITFAFSDEDTATLTPDNLAKNYVYESKITFTDGTIKTLTQGRLRVKATAVREAV